MSRVANFEAAPAIPFKVYAAVGAIVATAVIVGGAQLLPPLTGEPVDYRHVSDRATIHRVDERAFCQETMQGVDCGCFSYQASAILRADAPRIRGLAYADKWELAVAQAGAACRL